MERVNSLSEDLKQVDIIVFGAHPDDVEIGCGGLVAKEAALGYRVGIVDLTRGEMGTNGTIEERQAEGEAAAKILGAVWRKNLDIPDRNIQRTDENLTKVVSVLRKYRPTLIIIPYWNDRHPDHVAASNLVTEAHFTSGLIKFLPELKPYRPKEMLYYFLNYEQEPSFVVNVTDYYEQKRQAIKAHESQFGRKNPMIPTVLNTRFPYRLDSRDRHQGAKINAEFGEGFVVRNMLAIKDPLEFWK